MNSPIKLHCLNTATTLKVDGGTTLAAIAEKLTPELGFRPICAHVNNKTEPLSFAVYAPKTVEFLGITTPSGERTYIRSLCMLLYRAVETLYPGTGLSIEHSISRGYYCMLHGREVTDETVGSLERKMREMVEADLPFKRCEQPTGEVEEIFTGQGLHDKVQLMRTRHEPYTCYYRLDGLADSYYGALAPSTSYLKVFSLKRYKEGMLLSGFDSSNPSVPPQAVTQEKMYEAFTDYLAFNDIVGVRNVGELNLSVEQGHSAMLINVSETLHDKRIGTIADRIASGYRRGGARIVLIAGPSSSGKTTFTKRLAIHLMTALIKPQMISLDNYFVDREHTPRDENGEYDYESINALDIAAFNSDLRALLDGKEVELPYYDFATGTRCYRGDRIRLDDNSVLLIEGIHGLNPALTPSIDASQKYLVYVSALTTISIDNHNWVPTTDNRLLRRIIRDARFRGTDAVSTIRRWPSVRRGEERWIFPYQENADSTFNSSLLFELGVLKRRGEELLRRVPHDLPEYAEAVRLRTFLAHFEEIDENLVPSTSILREFLGGSTFKY